MDPKATPEDGSCNVYSVHRVMIAANALIYNKCKQILQPLGEQSMGFLPEPGSTDLQVKRCLDNSQLG